MDRPTHEAVAIHTAARRYCMDAHSKWCDEYARLAARGEDRENDGYHYTPKARRTFPRYNVLAAILVAVETIEREALGSFEDTRELLIATAAADNEFTRAPQEELEFAAMQEERDAFTTFVRQLSPADLANVTPLPYRRVLSAPESELVRRDLRRRWDIAGAYWFPLDGSRRGDLIAFEAKAFRAALLASDLRTVLRERDVDRFWELREYGPQYECEVAWFDPFYNGAEGYWSSAELDWIVYASHESSITIGGWLLDDLKGRWAKWQDHLWAFTG